MSLYLGSPFGMVVEGAMHTPALSAMMCDGMGWFSDVDYRKMLLTYDEIHYLLPETSVPFTDFSGRQKYLLPFINPIEKQPFTEAHFVPTGDLLDLMAQSARTALLDPGMRQAVDDIPEHERRYTWRAVNADGDLARRASPGLKPVEEALAHLLLLDKFLLAARQADCIPITGKPYIHALIAAKYRLAVGHLRSNEPDLLPLALREGDVKHNPVVERVVSAIVPDDELARRTDQEVIDFKREHAALFNLYSLSTRKMVAEVASLPASVDFEREVKELLSTTVWKEKHDIEGELRGAWGKFFKSAIAGAAGGLVGVGVAPFLSLGTLTLASVFAAATTVAPWAVRELLEVRSAKRAAEAHGLYYLLSFRRG